MQSVADPLIGAMLGGARIERRMSQLPSAHIYLGFDRRKLPLAVKVLSPQADEGLRVRFVNGGRALQAVEHPNIIRVHRIGIVPTLGLPYVVMDWVTDGVNLSVYAKSTPLEPGESFLFVRRLAEALDCIHRTGFIHRDIRPANICYRKGGHPLLLDFTLVKEDVSQRGPHRVAQRGRAESPVSTKYGPAMPIGTINYVPPEQAQPAGPFGPLGPWSDTYSLTATLYWLVTGQPPFKGSTDEDTLLGICRQAHAPPSAINRSLPPEVDAFAAKGLAKRSQDRFPTARDFMAAADQLIATCGRDVRGARAPQDVEPEGGADVGAPWAEESLPVGPVTPASTVALPTARSSADSVDLAQIYAEPIGRMIDDSYLIEGKLGEGGMGAVYKAKDVLLNRPMALKLVQPSLAGKEEVRERFLREARAAMGFVHTNAVPVRQCRVSPEGLLYMAIDFSPGMPLRKLLEQGRVPIPRALGILCQCLLAIGEAHRHGIVHRDLKPENILVESDGEHDRPRILDFGIAKIADVEGNLTGCNVIGTVEYMAPEQGTGGTVDGRADLYSMGIVLYEMLTGKVPFEADMPVQVLMLQATEEPEPPRQRAPDAGISKELEALILRVLAKDPNDRPKTAEDFIGEIEAVGIQIPGWTASRAASGKYASPSKAQAGTAQPSGARSRAVHVLVIVLAILVVALMVALIYVLRRAG